jgi:hypothetical protein
MRGCIASVKPIQGWRSRPDLTCIEYALVAGIRSGLRGGRLRARHRLGMWSRCGWRWQYLAAGTAMDAPARMRHRRDANGLTRLVAGLNGFLLLRSNDGIDLSALLHADFADFLRALLRGQGRVRANSLNPCVGGFHRSSPLLDGCLGHACNLPARLLLGMNCACSRSPWYPGGEFRHRRNRRLRKKL